MRKISVKIGVTAAFALALASFAGAIHNDAWAGIEEEVVDCAQGESIADAIDDDEDIIITIKGTCTEIVTVTTNGVTFRGDPVVGGTLMGGFIVDGAQRVVIDNLTIDGGCAEPCEFDPNARVDGVLARNNAHVTVRNCTIENHARSGVSINSTSSGLIEGNTIGNNADYGVLVNLGSFALLRGTEKNPTQTITSASNFNCCGNALGVFNTSDGRLNGGNEIEGTGSAVALSVFSTSYVRLQRGLNTVTSTQNRAIGVGRNSEVALRWFVVTGRIDISAGSEAEIRRRLSDESGLAAPPNIAGVVNGDIRVRSGAHVQFPGPFLARNPVVAGLRQGSVTVNGRLLCFGDQSRVSFGTGFGQTIQDVFPSQANREASQCNDFNGNVVLPAP